MLEEKRGMIEDTLVKEAETQLAMSMIEQGADPESDEFKQALSPQNIKSLPEIEEFFKKDYRSMVEEWATHQMRVDEERFKLQERYEEKTRVETRLELTNNVRFSSGKDGLISVQVDDTDPKFAADLANAHVEELGKLLGKLATTEAQQRRLFFEKQLTLAKEKLIQSELELKATGVSGSVLKSNPASAVAAVAGLQAGVTAQEVKLGAMRGYLAETAPEFKQALNELANLKAQLAKQEKDTPSNSNMSAQGDYVSKYREFKYNETLFELFAKQFEIAKVDESREGAVIQTLDAAQPPEKKSKPKKALIAIIATLAAGFALLLFVFIRQALNNAGKDQESANKLNQLKASWQKAIGKA
jgi:capsule polysaccharide export protein KpsE/RkpR